MAEPLTNTVPENSDDIYVEVDVPHWFRLGFVFPAVNNTTTHAATRRLFVYDSRWTEHCHETAQSI